MATSPNQTARFNGTRPKTSTSYNFRVQSAPPLSIQQFLRSATGVITGAKQWQPSGIYRPPPFHAYVPPTIRERRRPVESVWHPPGQYRDKRPTSLSPEKRPIEHIDEPIWHPPGQYKEKQPTSLSPEKIVPKPSHEPVWRPAGKREEKPLPYFDPPNLRWSLQELLRSMPELRPQPFHSSRSMSKTRKSIDTKDA